MTKLRIQNKLGVILGEIEFQIGKTLLSQIEAAGIEIPNACRTGSCASCLCTILQGQESIIKNFRGEPAFPLAEEEVMTCIGSIRGGEQVILQTLD